MSTIINAPATAPAAQQLVVAQCAMQTEGDLIFGKKLKEFKDHHVCVAAHTPVWFDRTGLHSDKINKDVIQVSACGSLFDDDNAVPVPMEDLNTANELPIDDLRRPPNNETVVNLQVLGVAQSAISDGSGVRRAPEAMGRLGVAIGGLVSMVALHDNLKDTNAKIGDYILAPDTVGGDYTISGAPPGLEGVKLHTNEPEPHGQPERISFDPTSGDPIYMAGTTIGRIFQFGPGADEVQVLLC